MWQELLVAIGLMLVIEGISPFINPAGIKRILLMVIQMNDTTLRIGGFASMMLGLILIYVVK